MRARIVGGVVGVVFGITLCWTRMSSPEVIREGLLFGSPYLFLFFGSAFAVASGGQWLARWLGVRALLTGERVGWARERPQRRHLIGSVVFGVGWAVADACPGPIITQVGQGIVWGAFTLAGAVAGIVLYGRRAERAPSSEPDRGGSMRSPASSPSAASSGA
jgi:uncharacterized membrane protein YedE/YeeE